MYKEKFPSGIEALDALSLILNSEKTNANLAQDIRRHLQDIDVAKAILADETNVSNALLRYAAPVIIKDVVRHLELFVDYVHCRIGEIEEAEELYLILQTLITHLMIAIKRNKKLDVALLQ